ncbi:MAG: pilus assembly protein N-terminal domain-containing protein [Pseudorhodobacter sp.]|nr:pilus assembly protein N-terminal domain-containing protein [Pseudorhodobacter sp.]
MQVRRCLVGISLAAMFTVSGSFGIAADMVQVAFPPKYAPAPDMDQPNSGAPTVGGLRIVVDFAAILHVEGGMSVIAVGNPAIADANLVNRSTMIVTGHLAGTTNVLALDDAGHVLADVLVRVSAQKPGMVTVRRGTQVEVHSCITGLCEVGPNDALSPAAPLAAAAGS